MHFNNMSENMCSLPMLLLQILLEVYIPSLGSRFVGLDSKISIWAWCSWIQVLFCGKWIDGTL